jgi:hypothetical protein
MASYCYDDDAGRVTVYSMGFVIDSIRAQGLVRSFRSDKYLFVEAFCNEQFAR